jgi:transposase-like protein
MRIHMKLPEVKPSEHEKPKKCPTKGCKGTHFYPRQETEKKVLDPKYSVVKAIRYECSKCGCTFRVYPQGVGRGQMSHRVKGIAVMLYVLGLSYGAVSLMMEALGIGIGKTSVYEIVQAVAEKVPGMKQENLLKGYRTKAVGADVTSVRCKGRWIQLGVTIDATQGMTLTIDSLPGEDAEQLQAWLEPILDAVDADVLVSDDADGLKKVADETGRAQQVCKSHVGRNTDELVDELSVIIRSDLDHSLEAIGVTPEQALADLALLKCLVHTRRPEDQEKLEKCYLRYARARKPGKGKKYDVAFRIRNLFLDRWNLWPRLTFYRTWKDEYGHLILDGTNNDCERSIGWNIKERYRTMRGYKREQSALNVSRLIAHAGNHRRRGLDLATLIG